MLHNARHKTHADTLHASTIAAEADAAVKRSHAARIRAILHRLDLDRRLGAPPSLASVNRALRLFARSTHDNSAAAAAMDLMEDELLESARLPASTLEAMVESVADTHPVWAARLAFMQEDMYAVWGDCRDGSSRCEDDGVCPRSALTLPLPLWQRLGAHLARMSEQQANWTHSSASSTSSASSSQRAHDSFLDVFERVLHRVRAMSTELSEADIVTFGRAMLSSGRPLTAVVRLVQEELLSGRNRDAAGRVAALQLSAFLSDLLDVLCSTRALVGGGGGLETKAVAAAAERSESSANASVLVFAGDVIKYAFARKLQLSARALDRTLRLCDEEKAYGRLCVCYSVMCILSVPTLTSFLRLTEVMESVPALVPHVCRLLGHTPLAVFYLWNVRTFGSLLTPTGLPERGEALRALCRALGTSLAHKTYSSCFDTAVDFIGTNATREAHTTDDTKNNNNTNNTNSEIQASDRDTEDEKGLAYVAHMFDTVYERSGPYYAAVFLSSCIAARRALPLAQRIGGDCRAAPVRLLGWECMNARTTSVLLHRSAHNNRSTSASDSKMLQGQSLPRASLTEEGRFNSSSASSASSVRTHDATSAWCHTSHALHESGHAIANTATPFAHAMHRLLIPVPQRHCNIVDDSALNALAASSAAVQVFVGMMQNYARRDGATAVVPVELLVGEEATEASSRLTPAARALVAAWRDGGEKTAAWFALLPLSFCWQLEEAQEGDGLSVCAAVFHRVRQSGHRRVALITADAESAVRAREAGVVPTIVLSDLLSKLAAPTPTTTTG